MKTAILLFDGVTALDAIGPYEVLQNAPDNEVCFVASSRGMKRTDFGRLGLQADYRLDEIDQADILLVPGTPNPEALLSDGAAIEWIGQQHAGTQWTTSVCTGALGLAAAGVLKGRRATTHWMALEGLREFGAEPVSERVVEDGKIMTAAGVSSGIDMALTLVSRLFDQATAERIQLIIEYDPQPPFDAGSPSKAPAEMVDALVAEFGPQM
ncbi:MAG: DJ-1/PfpI family protein [Gammaproteobacteria bacterium]|nr:DJ-1/PfpI family protein [Gammaproteobacteria bacterium]